MPPLLACAPSAWLCPPVAKSRRRSAAMATRGVWQLRELVISYCERSGSSRGVREFLHTRLIPFASENPQLQIVANWLIPFVALAHLGSPFAGARLSTERLSMCAGSLRGQIGLLRGEVLGGQLLPLVLGHLLHHLVDTA